MERSKWCFPDAQPHNRANAENEHQTDGMIFLRGNTEILHISFLFGLIQMSFLQLIKVTGGPVSDVEHHLLDPIPIQRQASTRSNQQRQVGGPFYNPQDLQASRLPPVGSECRECSDPGMTGSLLKAGPITLQYDWFQDIFCWGKWQLEEEFWCVFFSRFCFIKFYLQSRNSY